MTSLKERYSQGRIKYKIAQLATDNGNITDDDQIGALYHEYSKGRLLHIGSDGVPRVNGICMRFGCNYIDKDGVPHDTINALCPGCGRRTVAAASEVFFAYDAPAPDPSEYPPYVPPTEEEMRQLIADKEEIDRVNREAYEQAVRDRENAERIIRARNGS